MDLATSRREDGAQGETELTAVDESGLSSQRATESFGNEQRRLKPDGGCFCELKGLAGVRAVQISGLVDRAALILLAKRVQQSAIAKSGCGVRA
jgi:hypothetical protein